MRHRGGGRPEDQGAPKTVAGSGGPARRSTAGRRIARRGLPPNQPRRNPEKINARPAESRDHLGGIKDLFNEFRPINFWDTANTKEFAPGSFGSRTELEADWEFYQDLRDTDSDPKRLTYYSGDSYDFFKEDGLKILAPTADLVAAGNKRKNWNDASYAILYRACGKRILFSGDSEDRTWEHILNEWEADVSDLDVLIAPHHGRHSGRNYEFLSVTKPTLTLYGNASSDHLAYKPWHNRGLLVLTNNQAGYIVLDILSDKIEVFAKNETYATNLCKENGWKTHYRQELDAWFLGAV